MNALIVIGVAQVATGFCAALLVRAPRPNHVRMAGAFAAVSMLPLFVLGLIPSAFSIAAVLALPGLAFSVAGVASPRVLVGRALQSYLALCLLAGASSTLLEAWWLSRCVELKVVIPDQFEGNFRMVQDQRGLRLRALTGPLVVSASGEVRVSDAPTALRCYSIEFRSPSGRKRTAEDRGVTAGPLPGGSASTNAEGTVHQWYVWAR